MTNIVYLQNDPNQMLYYKDSVPKNIKVVEPDAKMMLRILAQKLKLLEVVDLDWLCCAISLELPVNPVFYPTSEGITTLYEKSELVKWFSKDPKNKADPGGLDLNVTISQYLTPSPKELLDFVVKTTKFPEDFFVDQYKKQSGKKIPPEERSLLDERDNINRNERDNKPDSQQKSCFCLFLYSIFGCKGRSKMPQEKPEHSVSISSNL